MSMQLYDTYRTSGNELQNFFAAIAELDDATEYLTVSSDAMHLLSLDVAKSNDEKIIAYQYSATGPVQARSIKISRLKAMGADEPLINEALSNNKLMLLIGNRVFFTSISILNTLSARTGISGNRFYEPTHGRDAYIAETMRDHPFTTKLMYRNDSGNVNKVFAAFSGKYAPIPQKLLKTVIENLMDVEDSSLGKAECKNWSVSHFLSEINIEFPDKAKDLAVLYGLPDNIVPGIYLATSDTGNCAITARETWSIRGARSCGQTYKRVHKGSIDAQGIIEDIQNTIFSRYTQVPERLCNLMTIQIDNPAKTYKSVFAQLKITEAVGREVSKKLLEELEAEINPTLSYTAYDIALSLMEMPSRCNGLSKSATEKLSNAVYKAAFADYNGKPIENADSVYLAP